MWPNNFHLSEPLQEQGDGKQLKISGNMKVADTSTKVLDDFLYASI
jgi:hypothetical protein